MARFKTFVNGGSLLPGDLDAMEDDYEVAFGSYKHLEDITMRLDAPAAGTFVFVDGYTGSGVLPAAANGGVAALWLDPNRYFGIAGTSGVNPRTVQYNLGLSLVTNNTAIATTITAELVPISGTTGAGAAQAGITIGAAVAGSTAAQATPAASSLIAAVWSGDFAAPAVGQYAIAIVVTGACAANSSFVACARLTMRQI